MATEKKTISKESAEAQIRTLFEAFDLKTTNDAGEEDKHFAKLVARARECKIEVTGNGDDVKIAQILRGTCGGAKTLDWNWSRLGMGKARVKIGEGGVVPYGQAYTVAAPMIGYETSDIQKMHPVDLSVLEDIASFFQKI